MLSIKMHVLEPIKLVSANDVKNSAHVTSVRRKKKPKIRNYNIRD